MTTDQVRFGFHPSVHYEDDTADAGFARALTATPAARGVDDWAGSLHDVLKALEGLLERIDEDCYNGMDGNTTLRGVRGKRISTRSRDEHDRPSSPTLRWR